ncbi:MAG: ATP synthase F1 subunit gamma [Flavobacteriales bacterium]|jgi:F-type H+-transporting ATPase subunit gamma|nr:ATP synthase F1 subunit gamma [Flavobacteriales bacterium]|tara:strand:- start:31699 stop:32562 length:864 start_codon:yes stop_codon:yes gene_type:complete
MSNLKEIRSRITSISSTMKITSAMKMVSAAKLKKAQDSIQNIRPFSSALKSSIQNLLPNINISDINLTSNFASENKSLIIAISSNRGLCGGFNANVFKRSKEHKDSKNIDVICIGKKSAEQFKRNEFNIIATETGILDKPSSQASKKISQMIINGFLQGRWSEVIIVYNKFKNAATQLITAEPLLPISIDTNDAENNPSKKDYIFEPDKTQIINNLIPQQIHTMFFEAILNSIAAEHGARMTAMHKATDNAEELKQNLTLTYNRQRQAAITNEILEIVAGAEALKGT